MSFDTSQTTFLPVFDAIPDDWDDAKGMLTEQLRQMVETINLKESGYFLDREILMAGNLFASTNNSTRGMYRKVVNFGSLPNNTTKTVPHGITLDSSFNLTNLYLSATNQSATGAQPFDFSVQNYAIGTADFKLYLTETNIVVITTSNYSAFTKSIVVIEYVKEN